MLYVKISSRHNTAGLAKNYMVHAALCYSNNIMTVNTLIDCSLVKLVLFTYSTLL